MTRQRLYKVPEAARLLGLPESCLRRGISAQTLPHRRVGRHAYFSDDDLEQIVREAAVRPVAPLRRRRSA